MGGSYMVSKGEDITGVLKEYDIEVKGIKLESYKGKKGGLGLPFFLF